VLADAGRRLADSIDYDRTLHSVLELAVEFYCEHAILYLGPDAAGMELHATAHRDPERGRRIEQMLKQYVPRPNHPASQFAEAMRTGRPVSIREASRRVGRDVKAVHGDVTALLNAGLLDRVEGEGIIFPFDAVKVEFLLEVA